MESNKNLICSKCKVPLEEREVSFTYLERSFRHKVQRCPSCGQVYLPEELVRGRMRQVENALEEK